MATRRDQMFPKLTTDEIDRLRRFGHSETYAAGTMLFEAGHPGPGMFVVLSGRVSVTRHEGVGSEGHETEVVNQGPGEFLAEIGQLSGRPALVNGRALGATEVLLVPPQGLRALVVAEASLGERIMRALILRRVSLLDSGAGGPVLIGAADLPGSVRLQGFLSRNGHPFSVLDPSTDADAHALVDHEHAAARELPLVAMPDGTVLRNPDEATLARGLGLLTEIDPDRVFDLAVVGAGPAGLAAAVYAASEGLSVLVLDQRAPGGQAGASARIENYLGFPTGISGQALAGRAFVQAQKFGAEMAIPAEVARLDCDKRPLGLVLADERRVQARSLVIASGARYRRPDIPGLDQFDGRGVYYWASPIEAKLCGREEVVLVGGGNSAGQAVVFLAATAGHVHVVIRGTGLAASMSRYLIERIEAQPNVTVHTQTQITALEGDEAGLVAVRWRGPDGEAVQRTKRLFLFVGADPNTGWLQGCVALDGKGFVRTGPDKDMRNRAPLQTSIPGVFAIGDVRAASTKRVAAAVGEGAAAVAQIHAYLADIEP